MQCGLDPDVKVLYEGYTAVWFCLTKAGVDWLNDPANFGPSPAAEQNERCEMDSEISDSLLTKLLNDGLTFTGC